MCLWVRSLKTDFNEIRFDTLQSSVWFIFVRFPFFVLSTKKTSFVLKSMGLKRAGWNVILKLVLQAKVIAQIVLKSCPLTSSCRTKQRRMLFHQCTLSRARKRIKSQLEFHKMISLTIKYNQTCYFLFSYTPAVHAVDGRRMKLTNWIFISVCFSFLVHWSPFALLFILSSGYYVG